MTTSDNKFESKELNWAVVCKVISENVYKFNHIFIHVATVLLCILDNARSCKTNDQSNNCMWSTLQIFLLPTVNTSINKN